MAAELQPGEAAEGVETLREYVADYEPLDLLRDDDVVRVRRVALDQGRLVEVERILRAAEPPVQAVRLVDVDREDLGFAQPAVHRAREHHRVVAEDIGQRDRGAAEEAATAVGPASARRSAARSDVTSGVAGAWYGCRFRDRGLSTAYTLYSPSS